MSSKNGLKWKVGTHYSFTGRFHAVSKNPSRSKHGKKKGLQMLIKNIVDNEGDEFRDHVWIPFTKRFKKMEMTIGDAVRFDAKIYFYRKFSAKRGYGGKYLYQLEIEDPDDVQWQTGLKNIINFEVLIDDDE